jgi:hypothetical protein
MKTGRLLLLLPLALLLVAAAKKPALALRFHVETNARDGDAFAMPIKFENPPRDGYIERVPSLSERDVRAIFPTNAGDGSFGCAFMLTAHGRTSLQTFSTERRGSSLAVFVSTKTGTHQVIDLAIDKPITDGIIYVPRGLTQLEIAALQKQFPTAGAGGKRK